MPVVPISQQQQTLRAAPALRNTVVADGNAFGAQSARDVAAIGGAVESAVASPLAQNAQRMQVREDAEAVRRAFVEFDNRTRAYLHDPDNGVYNRRGAGAKGATTDTMQTIDEYEREVSEQLNSRQREALATRLANVKSGTLDQVARYESTEFRRVEEETTKAMLQVSVDGATEAYQVPELRDEYQAQGEAELINMARLHGWSPEVLHAEQGKFRSALHKGVIDRMIIDDPAAAKAYYDENIGNIDGPQQIVIERALKEGDTRQRSQVEADQIVASNPGNYKAQLAAARKIDDPEVRDATVTRVKAQFSESEQLRTQNERQVRSDIWAIIDSGGDIDDVPPGLWQSMDGRTQVLVRDYVERKKQNEQPDTDWAAYYNLNRLQPEDLVKQDLLAVRPVLADSQFQSLVSLQRSYRDAIAKDDTVKLATLGSYSQAIDKALDAAGIGTDHKDQRGQFHQAATVAIERKQGELGRDLTRVEINEVLGAMLVGGEIDRFGPNPDIRAFQVTPENADRFIPELSEADRAEIGAALGRAGKPVTEANILKYARAKVLKDAR